MRNFHFFLPLLSLVSGGITGAFTAAFLPLSTVENHGAWLMDIYGSVSEEALGKILFAGPFFGAAVFILGFFIMGYLFILPVDFYYTYTLAYLVTASLRCFGARAIPTAIMRILFTALYCVILCGLSRHSMKFSMDIFSGQDFQTQRKTTVRHLGVCLPHLLAFVPTAFFEWKTAPYILKFWVSF